VECGDTPQKKDGAGRCPDCAPAAVNGLTIIPPADLLQTVTVISQNIREFIDAATRRALALEVTTDDEHNAASECLNNLQKSETHIDSAVTEARRPVMAFAAAITASVAKLKAGTQDAKIILSEKIKLYRDEQAAARQAAEAEQRRLEAEAARAAEAERQARAQAAREAQARADAARQEQELLEWQAQECERLAADKILAGGNKTAEDVKSNAVALADAAEREKKAVAAQQVADEADRLARLAAAEAEAPVAVAVVAQAPVVLAPKTRGTKTKRVLDFLTYDVATLPAVYLSANETLLRRHILDGAVNLQTPGVTGYRIIELVTGSGR